MNKYNTYTRGPRKGQAKTLTDRVVRFLTEGLKKQEYPYIRSDKYRKFDSAVLDSFYWVGKAGSVRAGRGPSFSISMTSQIHSNMKLWERRKGLK